MSVPRIVEPSLPVFVTRRTVCRFYLLRPDRELTEGFLYCLGAAAERHGIALHAVCVMSTHVHLVFTDVRGVYPAFLQYLNRLFANVTKVLRGWGHEVFNAAGPSAVLLRTPGAVVDKVAYTVANPVACGAVRSHRHWPGFVTRVEDMGKLRRTVRRPARYFSSRGEMPESVELRLELPAALVELHGEEGARRLLAEALDAKERAARAEVRARGHAFFGAKRVRKASPYKRAKAYEVFGALDPKWATKGGGREAYLAEAERYRTFQAEYRVAWERRAGGESDVVFPYGTWLMRVRYGARCAEPPS